MLHGSAVTIEGVTFFGLGGGVPVAPFGVWSYTFTEEQAADLLQQLALARVRSAVSPGGES